MGWVVLPRPNSGRLIRAAIGAALLFSGGLPAHAADERQSLEELRNTVIGLLQALVDQGVISREKAEQMVKNAKDKAALDAAAVAKTDEGAVRVPYIPQVVQEQIEKHVEESVKPQVTADVLKEAKTEKWGIPGALPDWITRTRISGDMTLREEDILFPSGNITNYYLNYYAINQAGGFTKAGINALENVDNNRARFRGRLRLALDTDLSDSWSAGLRLATGNTSDLVSETQTFDGTAPYQFGLDKLFIRYQAHNAQHFSWLNAVVGRFENPYDSPTNLIFHRDLTFTGVAATGRFGLGDGSADQSHLFLTVGGHPIQEVALSAHDKYLAAAQIGANLRWGEGQKLRLAAGFFDYFNVTGRLNPPDGNLYNYTAPQFLRQGNTYWNIANSSDPSVQLYGLASKYRLANVNVTYELPLGAFVFGATADAVRNFGYDTAVVSEEIGQYQAPRTKGYQGELSFGTATVLRPLGWKFVAGFRHLERDAVIDAYTDSDFHFGGTDATGYYFVGELGLSNAVWTRLRYMSSNAIDGPTLSIDTIQLDLNTRF